jgi:flagellar hook assembly protein FlgD
MQLAHAAPRRASRRWTAVCAVAVASALALPSILVSEVRAAVIPTTPAASTAEISDATDGSSSYCTGQPTFKAVIVVGPVGGSTSQFEGWANKIASAASDAGMHVCKVYTPYADQATVRTAAKGADLFVTLMHGNGYPHETSSGGAAGAEPNDGDDSGAHGLGLNASYGSSALKYYGADWVSKYLHLAPNGIVILSHMCNTAGNSEDANRIPDYDLAIDHVDNFAHGFLASTSYPSGGHPSAVMALQSQSFETSDPRGTLIKTLMTSSRTLDQAFMTTYSRNTGSTWKDAYLPNFGAVGTTDFYVTKRSDGSTLRSTGQIHLDPDLAYPGKSAPASWDPHDPSITWLNGFAGKTKNIQNPNGSGQVRFGYVRSIVGDLSLKSSTWRAGAATGSTPTPTPTPTPSSDPTPPAAAPELTTLKADQAGGTYPAADESLPVFTPNGDGTSDSLTLRYKSSAAAKLRVTVTNSAGKVVRTFSVSGRKGSATFAWNGKTDSGAVAPDGTYTVRVHVSGGNSRTTSVKVLTAIKVPRTSHALLNASDGDSLARTATQSVAVHSTTRLLWRILDSRGDVVRTGMDNVRVLTGTRSWVWDGKDESGAYVPDGTYSSVVTATTSKGSYSHQVAVRVMAYQVHGDFSQRPGHWNTFTIDSAESQGSTPRLTVRQPGLSSYRLTLKKVSTNRWSAIWKARPGSMGPVTFTISGTDIKGGTDSRTWTGTIQ